MSTTQTKPKPHSSQIWNLPNQITIARAFLSVAVFALIAWNLYLWAAIVFVVAVSTDWVDGYIARKYNLVTVLGRILDPFVDKIIVLGTFIYLVAVEHSGVSAWMAVVIMGREILVTALRGVMEQYGEDFSASIWGKVKMVVQSVAVPVSLVYVWYVGSSEPAAWMQWGRDIALWTAVLITLVSGIVYIRAAIGIARNFDSQ